MVPVYGYVACAWATVACNGVMLVLSYAVGRKRYPIAYPLRKMGGYVILTAVIFALGMFVPIEPPLWRIVWRALLLCVYIGVAVRTEGLLRVFKR